MDSPVAQNCTEYTSVLSPVQARTVQALAQGSTITAAAESAGISRRTLYNWIERQPGFSAAVEQARCEYADSLRDNLKHLSALALDALSDVLTNPKASAGARVRAALAVLNRPQFPERGWTLPVSIVPTGEYDWEERMAYLKADYDRMRMEQALEKRQAVKGEESPVAPPPSPKAPAAAPSQVPRNAACPCGSGVKFKRCCGASAPPVLGQQQPRAA